MQSEAKAGVKALARVGIVAYGIVHLLIGWIALQVAIGGAGEEADKSGAIARLKQNPIGTPLLWLLVAGLVALALWQATDAVIGANVRDRDGAKQRAKHIGRALSYAALALAFGRAAMGSDSSSSQSQSQQAGTLLGLPGGQILLAIVGLIVTAVGVSQVLKGITKKFYEDIDRSEVPGRTAGFLEKFGMAGWTAKGIATTIAGLLVVWAAWTTDPSQASGIDGALKTLAGQPFGTVLLVLVGVGLVAFGLYCFGWAKAPQLTHHNR